MMGRDRRRPSIHDEFLMLAAAAVDGRIDADSAVALEAHLATCDSCRAERASMQVDHAWLAEPAAATWPKAEVREFVLGAARAPHVPRSGAPDRPWGALVAASLVIAVIGTGLLLAARPRLPDAGAIGDSPGATSSGGPITPDTCAPIPADPSARWPFDSPGDDRIGGLQVDVGAGTSWTDGVNGGGLRFSGQSDAELRESAVTEFGTRDFTVSLWVRFAKLAGEQVLMERWSEAPAQGWTLTAIETAELRLAIGTDRGAFAIDTTGSGLEAGRWHHVAARRNGLSLSVFVDGWRRASGSIEQRAKADLHVALPLLFGHRGDPRGFFLQGDLDEILIWAGRALSDREIVDLHRAGEAEFCEAAAGAGFAGTWITAECPTRDGALACSRWGDRSNLRLEISDGERPSVQYEDDAVAGCGPDGTVGPRRASGTAQFEGVHLWVTFTDVSCDVPSEGWSNPVGLYKTPHDAAIWDDPDGDEWGLVWVPG